MRRPPRAGGLARLRRTGRARPARALAPSPAARALRLGERCCAASSSPTSSASSSCWAASSTSSQYHAWLIDAKRESLRAQGEIIAAAIAANAPSRRGRIVLDPDRLPEIEGAQSPFRDDGFAALSSRSRPSASRRSCARLCQPTDTRARVYAQDGTLIIDTAQLARAAGRSLVDEPSAGDAATASSVKNIWTRLAALADARSRCRSTARSARPTARPIPRCAMALRGSSGRHAAGQREGRADRLDGSADPVRATPVQGVLLLSTRPGEIDEILREERNVILAAGARSRCSPRCSPRSCSRAPSPAPCAGCRRRPRTSAATSRRATTCRSSPGAPTRSARWRPPSAA